MDNTFFTVGTNDISNDFFRPVQDSHSNSTIKPKGGLWLTMFQKEIPNYNIWADYLRMHPYLLFYKRLIDSSNTNPFQKPCSVVTLKKEANIFWLDHQEKLVFLKEHYPYFNGQFSFEALSKDYDGIYIALNSLCCTVNNHDWQLLKSFGVDSLLLFRTSPVEYYQKASLIFEPFDYEGYVSPADIQYTILVEEQQNYVKSVITQYQFFTQELPQIFLKYVEEQKMTLKELIECHLLENFIYEIIEKYPEGVTSHRNLKNSPKEIIGNLCKKLTRE